MLFPETAGCGYVIADLCGLKTNKKKGGGGANHVKCMTRAVEKTRLKQNQYLLKGINVRMEVIIVWRFLKY